MPRSTRMILGLTVLPLLTLGLACDTADPGGGLTNPNPGAISSEKPADRTDLGGPPAPETDDPTTAATGGGGTDAGTGGRGGGIGGLDPAEPLLPDGSPAPQPPPGPDVRATPPAIEQPNVEAPPR